MDARIRHRDPANAARWSLIAAAALFALDRSKRRGGRIREDGERNERRSPQRFEGSLGRQAVAPSTVPAKGWKGILWGVYASIGDDRLLAVAAGVTYYVLLAIFPAIGALISIYGLVADPSTVQNEIQSLSGVLPAGAVTVIRDQAMRVVAQSSNSLSIGVIFGLLIALWSANSGIAAIFDALNVAYDEKEKRSFFRFYGLTLLFTLGAICFLIAAVAAVAAVPALLNTISFGPTVDWAISIVRWPVMLAIVALAIAVLFRYGPSRDHPKWRWVSWGSAVASIGWLCFSLLFTWYVANFGTYNKTYGSLGAVIGFMVWIWLSMVIVLLGAEIDAEIEHQAARTTAGEAKF